MGKLIYNIKNKCNFNQELNYLEVILKSSGIKNVKEFLNVNIKHTYSYNLLSNINEAIECLIKHINKNNKIHIIVDSDCDGYTSAAILYNYLSLIYNKNNISWNVHLNKEHGIILEELKKYDYDLLIVPDGGSNDFKEHEIIYKQGKDIIILDHHNYEKKETKAIIVNNQGCNYPNKELSGAGIVYKYCQALDDKFNIEISNKYLDLVALGMIADMCDMRELETRYYTLEGLKEENRHNLLIKEMAEKYTEEMKLGHTITSYGWAIAPKINGVTRYGKEDEQKDLFRAFIGEMEDIEYQPRRKNKDDPKPPKEIHSLQKTMARVAGNVKARQDTQVRKFMKEIDEQIVHQKLENDKVIILDGTDVLEKKSVSGLVANKLVSKYRRPIIILKRQKKDNEVFGGSARGYEKGSIKDFREFLECTGLFDLAAGHSNACGVKLKQDKVQIVRDKCNELLKDEEIVTVHDVDYEISADKLSPKNILEVASAYNIWGNKVSEPVFAITNIDIIGKDIIAYGDNKNFIKFKYNNVDFIKKYCSKGEFEEMSLRDRTILGENLKQLRLTVIGNFVFNDWDGNKHPQIKIKYFYTEERSNKIEINIDDIF